MSVLDGIKWFKQQFGAAVGQALSGTPFSVDMAAAIAVQETYSDCWGITYQSKPIFQALTAAQVLQICVGDTLDAPSRNAFPKSKADLVQAPNGQQMFTAARNALLAIAKYNKSYATAAKNPDKFCHGYGIFQYDIQFFPNDQAFFLQNGWYDIGQCIARLVKELNAALKTAYGPHKTSLNDTEMMYVAIAYNCGHVNVNGGPKQGFKDGDGVYYGENFQKYLAMAHTVTAAPAPVAMMADAAIGAPAAPAGAAKAGKKPAKPKTGKSKTGKSKTSARKAGRKPARQSKARNAAGKTRGKKAAAPRTRKSKSKR
jgi:hypothetical protein